MSPAVAHSTTLHATTTRILKLFIDDIVLEMFIWFPWKLKTNRQTRNALIDVYNLIIYYEPQWERYSLICSKHNKQYEHDTLMDAWQVL